jgi:DNA-binding transcriptional regulator YdaS (Cro superfamily)
MKNLQKAIDCVGSQAELASDIDVTPQAVHNWLRRGNVPAEHCPAIERATAGAVRCEDLRPDVEWAYLRNSHDVTPPGATSTRSASDSPAS